MHALVRPSYSVLLAVVCRPYRVVEMVAIAACPVWLDPLVMVEAVLPVETYQARLATHLVRLVPLFVCRSVARCSVLRRIRLPSQ